MSGRGSVLWRACGWLIDRAIFPLSLAVSVAAASALLGLGVPNLLVTPLVVGPFAGAVALLERLRPERPEHVPLDMPLWVEAAHFVFSFEFGYGLALLACEGLDRWVRPALPLPRWPVGWPVALQLLLALALYEGTSYWQHRFIHRIPWFWRFHALHHSGERLNMVRAVRFHFVDIGTAAFVAYVPLVLLAAPERVVTLQAVLLSVLGMLQHANLRMRTPRWLDGLICTPAIHRHHHSSAMHESDRNFGNTLMIFDMIFGTYARGRPEGPVATGVDGDPVPRGFWGQITEPFRAPRG